MAIKHLSGRSREEIIKTLEIGMLDKQLIEIIKINSPAYQFVFKFTEVGDDQFPGQIDLLNGLCEIIRGIAGK